MMSVFHFIILFIKKETKARSCSRFQFQLQLQQEDNYKTNSKQEYLQPLEIILVSMFGGQLAYYWMVQFYFFFRFL